MLLTAFWATLVIPAPFFCTPIWEFYQVLSPTLYKMFEESLCKFAGQKNAIEVPVNQFESGPNSVTHTAHLFAANRMLLMGII